MKSRCFASFLAVSFGVFTLIGDVVVGFAGNGSRVKVELCSLDICALESYHRTHTDSENLQVGP